MTGRRTQARRHSLPALRTALRFLACVGSSCSTPPPLLLPLLSDCPLRPVLLCCVLLCLWCSTALSWCACVVLWCVAVCCAVSSSVLWCGGAALLCAALCCGVLLPRAVLWCCAPFWCCAVGLCRAFTSAGCGSFSFYLQKPLLFLSTFENIFDKQEDVSSCATLLSCVLSCGAVLCHLVLLAFCALCCLVVICRVVCALWCSFPPCWHAQYHTVLLFKFYPCVTPRPHQCPLSSILALVMAALATLLMLLFVLVLVVVESWT